MLFTIDHTTEYRFTRPVFFEPHQLRFQPRNDAAQRLIRYDLAIDPAPAGMTQSLDAEGNLVTLAWFENVHEHMTIRTTSEVETLRENPFDYLLTSDQLPVADRLSAVGAIAIGPRLQAGERCRCTATRSASWRRRSAKRPAANWCRS